MLSCFRDTPVQMLDLPQVLAYLIVNFSATWSKAGHIPILCMHVEIEAMRCNAHEVVFRAFLLYMKYSVQKLPIS